MANRKPTVDPMFAAYAASAPRLDLRAYLDYASRHESDWTLETGKVVNDMAALYVNLSRIKPTLKGTAAKREVWRLIDAYKASIKGWHGTAGSPTCQDRLYFDIRAKLNAAYLDVPALTDVERELAQTTEATAVSHVA